jgi:hypothetical protein
VSFEKKELATGLSLAELVLEVSMKSTAVAVFGVLLVVTSTASAQNAQTAAPAAPAAPATNAKITVRGCVSPSQRDGSLEARSAPSAAPTPDRAPFEANSGEFVNAYLLTDATLVNGAGSDAAAAPKGTAATNGTAASNGTGTYMSSPSSFTLQGLEPELAKHKGHRVEVVGTVMPPTAAGKKPVTKAAAEGIQRLQISSVKMVGTNCKAGAGL